MIETLFERIKKPIYLLIIGAIYLSYFLVVFGIYAVNPIYIEHLSVFIQVFICLFLIIRFHPFRSHELRDFDDKLIFGSGLLLISNLGVTSYFQKYINKNLYILSDIKEII